MKKILAILVALAITASFAACGGAGTFELALITDVGTIDDKSFNQGSWEGLLQYATENNKSHKYYQPPEQSDTAYLDSIDLAVKGGAKVIVTPGFLFEAPIYEAQNLYPDVKFILVDGTPRTPDYSDFHTADNTVGVNFAEQEAGFLAGYAAVKDGSTRLGFMGGMAVPAVIRFGYGFVAGADVAAQEMGLAPGSVTISYHYTGTFEASPEIQTRAASWFNDGTQVIFACGGGIGNSIMAAAEQTGAKVIGVDIDQSGESASVITSAMKGLTVSVYDCIKAYYNGSFPGGQNLIFNAALDGVGLPMETSKFNTFSKADYDAIFARVASGEFSIPTETSVESAEGISVVIAAVTER